MPMSNPVFDHCCREMERHLSDPAVPVEYDPRFREYGLTVWNGGSATQLLTFCPWCGVRLPSSLRDQWFDRLEKLGLEPEDTTIPLELTTDKWWREASFA